MICNKKGVVFPILANIYLVSFSLCRIHLLCGDRDIRLLISKHQIRNMQNYPHQQLFRKSFLFDKVSEETRENLFQCYQVPIAIEIIKLYFVFPTNLLRFNGNLALRQSKLSSNSLIS